MLLLSLLCLAGCNKEIIPSLPPITRITATLHPLPDQKILGIDDVEVPESELRVFANLIIPSAPCLDQRGIELHPEMYCRIADVVVGHKDGSTSRLVIRDTGKNPPAVSLDGSKYYYSSGTNAFEIVRLLSRYDYESQKSPFNTSPIERITAKLHAAPKHGIPGIEVVEVPESELSRFASLVRPDKPSIQQQGVVSKPEVYFIVAEVIVEHEDKSMSNLIVRWTGKNPAAISLDGIRYYNSGLGEGRDAMSIVRLLQEYNSLAH